MSRGNETDAQFGRKVAELREGHGISQTALSKAAGLGYQQTVARIEVGSRPATIGEAVRLACALGVALTDLVSPGAGAVAECVSCTHLRRRIDAAATALGGLAVDTGNTARGVARVEAFGATA